MLGLQGGGRALHQGLALSRGGVSPVTSLQRQSRTVTNEGLVIAGSFPRAEGTAPPPSFWNQFFVTSAVLGASARHPASQQHPDLSLRTFLIRGTCFQRLKSAGVNRPWPSNAIELDYLKWFETQSRAAAAVHSIQHTSISPISTLPFKLLGEKRKVPFQLSHIQNLKNVLLWKRIFCQKITLLLGFLGSG